MKKTTRLIVCSLLFIVLFHANAISSDDTAKSGNSIQRESTGFFDLQHNTVSNIEFYMINNGIFGFNAAQGKGGVYWPRGSMNQYIFAGGLWFGAQKFRPDTALMRKYVVISYNPSNGRSWFVPGRAENGNDADPDETKKYRNYFSTDFNKATGSPLNPSDGPNWPIWDASVNDGDTLRKNRYFGNYINDESTRNTGSNPKGPAFISEEDVFSTYKDTDLTYYDGGEDKRKQEGYPLGLQVNQTIYSWGSEDMKDMIIIRYEIENISDEVLYDCWFAPLFDVDIAREPNISIGAKNDRVKYYEADTTLNTCIAWTDTDGGEAGYGFGYIGFTLLESPTVIESGDSAIFIRNDKISYDLDEQLGLVTFRNWASQEDILDDENRYNYIAMGIRGDDMGPDDRKLLFATGPFHMRPGDVAKAAVMITFANTANGGEADGSDDDLEKLITKIRRGIVYYYEDLLSSVENNLSGNESDLSISPNPAVNHATLSLNMLNPSSGRVEIANVIGQPIYRNETEFTSGLNKININTSSFPAGIYFVNIISGNFRIQKQFVVAR